MTVTTYCNYLNTSFVGEFACANAISVLLRPAVPFCLSSTCRLGGFAMLTSATLPPQMGISKRAFEDDKLI